MANCIGVMYLGRLVEIGETEALFARPRHPYTRMLLDAVPDLSMSGRARTPVGGEPPNPIYPPPGCPFIGGVRARSILQDRDARLHRRRCVPSRP